MRVLVACEFSGIVRSAFRDRGHDAWSADLREAEDGSPFHMHGDCLPLLSQSWDLIIAHPPCTDLAVSGARWFKEKGHERQRNALDFFRQFLNQRVRYCVENPVSIASTRIRKPDQIIHPWQFGHGETKTTCLWLNGLFPLRPTCIVVGRENRIHRMSPGVDREKERSRTYAGIAKAMAEQWG